MVGPSDFEAMPYTETKENTVRVAGGTEVAKAGRHVCAQHRRGVTPIDIIYVGANTAGQANKVCSWVTKSLARQGVTVYWYPLWIQTTLPDGTEATANGWRMIVPFQTIVEPGETRDDKKDTPT